jgi:hypothetical protein
LRVPKFRRDRRACLAIRPGHRTQRRTVVITVLSVTSDLAGRLQPCRAEDCLAGHGVAGGDREDRGPAPGPEEGGRLISAADSARDPAVMAARPAAGMRRSLVAAIVRGRRLAAGIQKCRTVFGNCLSEWLWANERSGDAGAAHQARSASYCGEIVTRADRRPPRAPAAADG